MMEHVDILKVRVGFVGLGRMGSGMGSNLVRAGVHLTVFDTMPEAVEGLTGQGARAAGSLADLASSSDVIFTSLPGPAEVEQVILGRDGIAAAMRRDTVLFDLSSSARSLALRIAEAFRARDCEMLDAPVSGGPAGAKSGDLVLWVGGNRDTLERHRPLLETFCKPHHVGSVGTGTVTKLAHNMLGYTIMAAQAEAFTLATKAGMDPLDFWQALRLGIVGKQSPLLMLTRQFLPCEFDEVAFAQRLALKDVRLAVDLADELDVPMPLSQAMREDMEAVVARGEGERDSRSFLQLQVERAGVTIKVPRERIEAAEAGKRG